MAENKYYKLGAKASNFWDASQPDEDNKKLTLGQVKALHPTKNVQVRVANGGLVIVEKDEYTDYQKTLKDLKSGSAEKALSKTTKEANEKTKVALLAKEKAEGDLKLVLGTNEELVEANEAKESELVELRSKVEAFEAAANEDTGEGSDNPKE